MKRTARWNSRTKPLIFCKTGSFGLTAKGREYIRLVASDAIWLLDTAIVAAFSGSEDAEMTGIPDDLMKAIVSKQLGSTASAWRSKITEAPNLGAGGASISKAFAYRNVLTVVQELADLATEAGVWLGFDVVRTAPGAFEFPHLYRAKGRITGAIPEIRD